MARSALLAPFEVRGFRFQWPADLLTSWGIEMEILVLGWFILAETGSVLLLTVFGSLQYVGTLIAPGFGMAGDRFGHRNVLCAMRATYAALAMVVMVLAFMNALLPLYVLIIAGISGIVRPSDLAIRNTLVAEIMPGDRLMGAMGVSRTTSDSARIGGSLLGASMLALLGMGYAYAAITVFYLLGLGLTLAVRTASRRLPAGTKYPSFVREVGEGLVYVWHTPRLLAAMWLAFLVNMTAFPMTSGLMPYVAKEVYHIGQTGLGSLVASFAFGGLLGSLVVSVAGRRLRAGRMMVVFALAWYSMVLIFAQMPNAAFGRPVLVLAGFAQSLSMVPMAAMLLQTSDIRFRGRVMGVRMLAIYGLPVGLLAIGFFIQWFGFRASATAYCVFGLAVTLLIALRWRADIWPLDAAANGR